RPSRRGGNRMDLQLDGLRAVGTRSSAGLGGQIARRLAAEGASGVGDRRRGAGVQAVVGGIKSRGDPAAAKVARLADTRDCARFIADTLADGGPAGVLVNNAGAFVNRGWDQATPEDWLELYAVNVAAAVRLIHGFLPAMRAARFGRIIQIGTGEAINPFATMPDYAASKAAPPDLTATPSKHLARSRMTVNTARPRIIVSRGVQEYYRKEAARRGWPDDWAGIEARILAEILDNPVGRLGRPDEVAALVALVASPLAGYINGANLRID